MLGIPTDVLIAFGAVFAAAGLGGIYHWYLGKKEAAARHNHNQRRD
jgi:hypothetical protein